MSFIAFPNAEAARMHEGPAPGAPERASHAATATVSSKMAGARRILEGLAYTTLTGIAGFSLFR
jgi:hypothetical protein